MERRTKRVLICVFAAFTACVPAACLSGAGDAPSDAAGDPSTVTFGAEVTVNVVGRGSVMMDPEGISCPPACFARALVTDAGAEAGEGGGGALDVPGFTLEARPSDRARFVSWTFEQHALGARGRGPASCNPVMRESVIPTFAPSARVIALPYGETSGRPPVGREAECAPFTSVPVAYAVTATFEEDESDVLFESPVAGATASSLGLVGNRLYWLFHERMGKTGIASGLVSQPGSAQVIVPATGTIALFDVGIAPVFTTVVPPGEPPVLEAIRENLGVVALPLPAGAQPCIAIASGGGRVYCRNPYNSSQEFTNLHSWDIANDNPPLYDRRQEYYLRAGVDIAITSNPSSVVHVTQGVGLAQTEILVAPLPGPVGPIVATGTRLVSSTSSPHRLRVARQFLTWVEDVGISSTVRAIALSGGPSYDSLTDTGFGFHAPDTDGSTFWAALARNRTTGRDETWDIVRASIRSTTSEPSIYRDRAKGVGGVAAGAGYVYWTQSDGRVYRARKR